MRIRKTSIILFLLMLGIAFFAMTDAKTINAYSYHKKNGNGGFIKGMKPIYKKLEKHSVSIFNVNPGMSLCTGVVIDKDEKYTYVITCKHCLSMNEEYYVENSKVKFMISVSEEDLMYLVIEGNLKDKEPVIIVDSPLIDEKVYYLGYPSLHKDYVSEGKIVRYSDDWGYANLTIKGGCSGGGIFNKKQELVGIVWGYIFADDVTIFESSNDVKLFLEKIKERIEIK